MPYYLLLVVGVGPIAAGVALIPARSRSSSPGRDLVDAHDQSFRVAFAISAAIALVCAISSYVLIRTDAARLTRPVFGRRSRWLTASAGAHRTGTDETSSRGRRSSWLGRKLGT